MSQIRAIQARGLLTYLARQAQPSGQRMIDLINSAQDAVLSDSFRQGRVYVSASGSGQSHSFLIPTMYTAEYSPAKVAEQLQEFIEIYQYQQTSVANGGTGLITDENDTSQVLAAMLNDDRLQTVTRQRLDITGIRFPGNAMQASP